MQVGNRGEVEKIIKKQHSARAGLLNLQNINLWRAVLQHQDWSSLKELNLRNCRITDADIKVVTQRQWPSLRKLLLWRNLIGLKGARHIADKQWERLEFLDLDENSIGDDGLECLASGLPVVTNLQVAGNSISKLGIQRAFLSTACSLFHINLSDNRLGLPGVMLLVKAPMEQLFDLNLSNCQLGQEGARHLTKGSWKGLLYLHLDDNKIGLGGCEAITGNSWRLRYLSLGEQSAEDNLHNTVEGVSALGLSASETPSRTIHRNVANKSMQERVKRMSNKYY